MNAPLSRARWQTPRIDRNDRWVGGVAAAIAKEIGVQPLVIRAAFIVLALVGGWGLLLYVLTWAWLAIFAPTQISPYHPVPKGATALHRHLGIGMVVVGLMTMLGQLTSSAFTSISWPIGFVFIGALIAWSRGNNEPEGISIVVRIVAGLAVAIGGLLAFAALSYSLWQAVVALIFGIAIIGGITIIAAPSVLQMARSLDGERLDRIRLDERARISAHLHDSVLQTLTLIQRNAEDPQRASQLARRQERELRNWLYGPDATSPGGVHLGPALEQAAIEVEETFGVQIDVVAVGDNGEPVPGDLVTLIAATKEAMTNAAVHAGVDRIDVFAERTPSGIEIFVRDTGVGFDPLSIDGDRHGVKDSIVARMERAGGVALLHSSPGGGTEVELSLPFDNRSAPNHATAEQNGAVT
jgi:signal transduction histidine kinase